MFKLLKENPIPLLTSGVQFGYKEQNVLNDVSLKVPKNKITAVIGKSGSGKSTFLKLVAGIISGRYKGDIKIFGSHRLLKQRDIGFVPQDRAFMPDIPLKDNIEITSQLVGILPKRGMQVAKDLMQQFQLHIPLSTIPQELSGGQQVRINIILSMLHDPKLLVMDEPFVGLDFKNRRLLWHFIRMQKKKGKSIVLTTHLLAETQDYADLLVILKDGKIFFKGDVEGLQKKLGISYIYEVRLSRTSKQIQEEIRRYCVSKRITILESNDKEYLIGLQSGQQKRGFNTMLEKLSVHYDEVSLREPNLDEIFMHP